MTTDETPSVQSEALSSEQLGAVGKKVEAVEQQIAALAAAQTNARRLRLLLPIGFLVFVCVFLWLFYDLYCSLAAEENLKKIRELAEQRVQKSLLPEVERQAKALRENALPALQDAFTKQVEKDAPRYTDALSEQGDELFKNLHSGLEEQLEEHFQTVLKKQDAVLKEEYPDLTDEKRAQLAANMEKAVNKLVKKYYVEQMKVELERMMETMNTFPVADPVDPTKPGAQSLEEELIGCLMEVVHQRMTNPQNTLLGDIDATD